MAKIDNELWERGEPLNTAWLYLGDKLLQQQFRTERNDAATMVRERLLQLDVCAQLGSGDLIAIGYLVRPKPTGRLERIPAHFFDPSADVGWSDDTVAALGFRYERVRVCFPPPSSKSERKQKPMGRPSIDGLLDEVIRVLITCGQLERTATKEKEHLIRAEAQRRYPSAFPGAMRPSRSKIFEALKRAGLTGIPGP